MLGRLGPPMGSPKKKKGLGPNKGNGNMPNGGGTDPFLMELTLMEKRHYCKQQRTMMWSTEKDFEQFYFIIETKILFTVDTIKQYCNWWCAKTVKEDFLAQDHDFYQLL